MSSVSGDLKPWWYNNANTLASSPWANITREGFVILCWELHPMCLPSFYPTNFLGSPPTVTGGGWKVREWGRTLSALSLSLHTFLSFMCPHLCMLAPVWAPGTEAIRWTLIRNIISYIKCVHDTHWLRQPQDQYRATVTWLLTCHVLWLFASTHLVQNHHMHPDTPVINK